MKRQYTIVNTYLSRVEYRKPETPHIPARRMVRIIAPFFLFLGVLIVTELVVVAPESWINRVLMH